MPHSHHSPHIIFCKITTVIDELRSKSIKQAGESSRKMLGLTIRQGSSLARLKMLTIDKPEGVSLKVLASHLQMTIPAASLLVEAMVTNGFFERQANPNDRRAVLIRLSEKGATICQEVYQNLNSLFDEAAHVLSDEEICLFEKLVNKIHDNAYSKVL